MPPQPTRATPAPGTPEAEQAAAFDAALDAQLDAIDDELTLDRVEGEHPAPQSADVSGETVGDLSRAMRDLDGNRGPPVEPTVPEQDGAGHDVLEFTSPSETISPPVDAFAEPSAVQSSAESGCGAVPGVPYQGVIEFQSNVSPIHNAQSGAYAVKLTNTGTQAWPVGTAISYQVFDSNTQPVSGTRPTTQAPIASGATVQANGGWIRFNATVGALPPGTWLLAWDIFVPGVGWLTDKGNCSSNLQLTISNQAPTITYVGPASPGTVSTKTPQLTVTTSDVDRWPNDGSMSHTFKICKDVYLTNSCATGSTGSGTSWAPPPLEWGGTYYWAVSVSDGQAVTDGKSRVQSFTVVVPAVDDWRRVGNGLGLAEVFGVVLPYGIFLHHQTDAKVEGGSFPLSIERTYSSGAANTEGSFGRGWMSLFDASVVAGPSGDNLSATYPDGRQETFGRSGYGWVARADLGAKTRVSRDNWTTEIKQVSGETLTYQSSTGRLLTVVMGNLERWELSYANGLVSRVTHQPSGRSINVEWAAAPSTNCSSGQRSTRPYVSGLSVDRGAGDIARWTYAYNCSRLISMTDPMGGVHRYASSATTFTATTPEGRQSRQLSSIGSWSASGESYEERVLRIGEPGSAPRAIRLLRPRTGYENLYRQVHNSFNGVTALYCGYRNVANEVETCGQVYDTLQFDTVGRLREKALREFAAGSGSGRFKTWLYNAYNGQLDGMRDENGTTVEYKWDGWGNLTSSSLYRATPPSERGLLVSSGTTFSPDPGSPNGPTRVRGSWASPRSFAGGPIPSSEFEAQYSYDASGRLIAHDGPTVPGAANGEQRSYAYTTGSEAAVSANGAVISGKKMPPGLLRSETTAAGSTISSYDHQGNLTRLETPGGGKVERTYDARGAVLTELVNGSALVQYTYDALGRVTREDQTCVTAGISGATTKLVIDRAYDRDGLPRSISQREVDCASGAQVGESRATTYSYTAQGRPSTVTDAAGGVTRYEYSGANPDQVIRTTDARGRVTENTYVLGTGALAHTAADIGVPGSTTRVHTGSRSYDLTGRKIWESDALGRTTDYTVTSDGFVVEAKRSGVFIDGVERTVKLWEREFDAAGNMTRQRIGETRLTTYIYDAMGRLYETVVDPERLNRTTRIERDSAGRELGHLVSDANGGSRTTFNLNADGFVLSERTWLSGNLNDAAAPAATTSYGRDLWGNAIIEVDPRGWGETEDEGRFSTEVRVDKLGRVMERIGPRMTTVSPTEITGTGAYTAASATPARAVETIQYNAFGDITASRDAKGAITGYRYDGAGRLVETHLPDYTDSEGKKIDAVLRYEYSAAGDLLRKIDARGGSTDYSYDISGSLVREEAPAVNGKRPTTRYSYDAVGQMTDKWDANGVRTTLTYDALGRVVAETVKARSDPSDNSSATVDFVTSYTYDVVGNRTSVTTPQSRTTRFEYNAAGERTAMWSPGRSAPARWEYDHAGRVTKETESSGRATQHVFDAAGREIRTIRRGADGFTLATTRSFDAAGNPVSEEDPRGIIRRFEYDQENRMVSATQPTGVNQSYTTSIGYDAVGNAVQVRNGKGVNTWYAYNAWNLQTSVVEAPTSRHPALADRQWTTRYDVLGNAVKTTKPGGATTTAVFDALNRVTSTLAQGNGVSTSTSYVYDDGGRLRSAVGTGSSRVDLAWDDLGRLTTSQAPGGNHRFAYDADGLLATDESSTNAILGTISHARDAEGRPVRTTNTSSRGAQSWTFEYDPSSGDLRRRATSMGTTTFDYDGLGRTAAIKTTSAGNAVIQDVKYSYDSNDNVIEERIDVGPDRGGKYTYDWANRLTSYFGRDSQGNYPNPWTAQPVGWTWDDAGNRRVRTEGTMWDEWTYDERNRPVYASQDNEYSSTQTDFQVDARGNVIAIGERKLIYDARDHLLAEGPTKYDYDGLGRVQSRNGISFDYPGTSDNPSVVIDGNGNREIAIRGASGDILGTAGFYTSRNARSTRAAITDRHTDLTSGQVLTGGSAGSSTGLTTFDPFGQRQGPAPLSGFSNRGSSFGFQSNWTDASNGLVQMGARWYDASHAIFTSRDDTALPLLSAGGLNRYSYADGNPLSKYDPTGRSTTTLPDIDFDKELQKIVDDWHIDEFEKQFRPVVNEVGEWVAKGGLARLGTWVLRAGTWVGTRLIPYVGWGLFAWDALTIVGGIIEALQPPPPPPPPPTPTPLPPAPQPTPKKPSPVISLTTTTDSWVGAGTRVEVSNEGGSRVITTSWLADHYRETRVDYSNGAWNWMRAYLGRDVVDSLREVFGRVVDPSRVDQSHTVPGVAAEPWQQVQQGPQATEEGGCGVAGTLVSCATEARGIEVACADWASSATLCATLAARPGPAGAIGPATSSGSASTGGDNSPAAGAGGGRNGGGGNWKPPKWIDEFDCDDLPESERTQALREEFENGVKQEYWKNELATNPDGWSTANKSLIANGRAPYGIDGNSMEVHHIWPLYMGGDNSFENLVHLTRTDHRIGENFKNNHPC